MSSSSATPTLYNVRPANQTKQTARSWVNDTSVMESCPSLPPRGHTLAGSGDVGLNAAGQNAQLNTAAGVTLERRASEPYDPGRGYLNAALINNGTVTADVCGQLLQLRFQTTRPTTGLMAELRVAATLI